MVSIFFVLLTTPSLAVSQPAACGSPFFNDLAQYLGLSEHQTRLEQGDVVHTALLTDEQLPEEIVAVGAMLLVRGVAPRTVINGFMADETFRKVHEVERYQALSESEQEAFTFGQLTVEPESDLARAFRNPGRNFNLSLLESANLKAVNVKGKQGVLGAEQVWRNILENRLESFIGSGVRGIKPYFDSHGKEVSPAKELTSAIESFSFLENQFPLFVGGLLAPSSAPEPEFDQQYFWLETEFDNQNLWALSSELRLLQKESALASDLHFYASRGYFSMLTIIGVVPYCDHSLAFAVNHTYTDAVLGFAAGFKRRVGRKRVAEALSLHLETVRLQLE
ncbi:MAG: hypothetical protein DRR06_07095 [Gammaproteobacteria bacterium]|nr:MAG: hypothetical protein DRR06_07095 [Gammaproteobacteria bacterium]RLA52174.1 MAG: hypothetical protein DRR42_08300 [Gammaproteobacteria bacterium]